MFIRCIILAMNKTPYMCIYVYRYVYKDVHMHISIRINIFHINLWEITLIIFFSHYSLSL